MSVKEFAETYANGPCESKQHGMGRIVGYSLGDNRGHYVIVEFGNGPSWQLNEITDADYVYWVVPDPKWGWKVPISSIVTLGPPTNFFKPPKIAPAYPHKCSVCRNPARIIGRNILCSNTKCKSQKALRATYKIEEQDKLVATKRELFLDNWLLGGCVLCGKPELMSKPRNRYAHMKCWNLLNAKEEQDIRRSMRVYRKLKGID